MFETAVYLNIDHNIIYAKKQKFRSSSAYTFEILFFFKFHSSLYLNNFSLHNNYDMFKPTTLELSNSKSLERSLDLQLPTPSLTNTESNSHSLSTEFNLPSFSSDSGMQTYRLSTENMSGSGEISKSSDSENSPKHGFAGDGNVVSKDDELLSDDENISKSGLKRNNSVKDRANLFQALENKLKQDKENSDISVRPKLPRSGLF